MQIYDSLEKTVLRIFTAICRILKMLFLNFHYLLILCMPINNKCALGLLSYFSFILFQSDHGTHGCYLYSIWWVQHLLPNCNSVAMYLHLLQPGKSHPAFSWIPTVCWGWWYDTGAHWWRKRTHQKR